MTNKQKLNKNKNKQVAATGGAASCAGGGGAPYGPLTLLHSSLPCQLWEFGTAVFNLYQNKQNRQKIHTTKVTIDHNQQCKQKLQKQRAEKSQWKELEKL